MNSEQENGRFKRFYWGVPLQNEWAYLMRAIVLGHETEAYNRTRALIKMSLQIGNKY